MQKSSPRVLHFDNIDSTNAEAHRRAVAGDFGPLWIISERQSAGRGRLGRRWVSEPGNLYATYLFQVQGCPVVASQLSFVASLAVREAIVALGIEGDKIALKWPNDVLIEGKKCCGILPEVIANSGTGHLVVALGCGINLKHVPTSTPYPVTQLSAFGLDISPSQMFEQLARSLDARLEQWDNGRSFDEIRNAWFQHAIGRGGSVQAGEFSGEFAGLASDGALLIALPTGILQPVHAGEVRFAELERMRSHA